MVGLNVPLPIYIQFVQAKAIVAFSEPDPAVRRYDGNMNALWQVSCSLARGRRVLNIAITRFFVIAIVAAISSLILTYCFTLASAELTAKLRILSFRTVLRQDSRFLFISSHSLTHSHWTSTLL